MLQKINSKSLLKGDSVIASGERNDCTVYAIATAFDMSYDDAHKEVAERFGRQESQGAKKSQILSGLAEGTIINGKTVTKVINTPTSTYRVYGNDVTRKVRLSSFVKENQEGTYVILTRTHALTLKNGVVMDNNSKTKDKALVEVAIKVDAAGSDSDQASTAMQPLTLSVPSSRTEAE